MMFSRRWTTLVLFAAAIGLNTSVAHAVTKTFTANAALDVAGNWTASGVPGTTNEVLFNALPGSTTLTTTPNSPTWGDLVWNNNTTASITINTGTSTSRTITLSGGGGSTEAIAKGGATGDLIVIGTAGSPGTANTLTIGGNVGAGSGRLNLALGASGNFNVVDSVDTLNISGILSGSFGFTKTGAGMMILSNAANTYTGDTTVNAGTLASATGAAFVNGAGKGNFIVNAGGTLAIGSASSPTINGLSGSGVVTILAGGTRTMSIGANDQTSTFTGQFNQAGANVLRINKTGAGIFTYAPTVAGNHTGSITVAANSGILNMGNQNALYANTVASWTVANIFVNSGGTLAFGVSNAGGGFFTDSDIDILKALGNGSGGFRAGSSIGFDTTNSSGGTFSYSSNITDTNGLADSLGVTKLGTNTLSLSGNNTYTGLTTILNGTLVKASANGIGSGPLVMGRILSTDTSSLDLGAFDQTVSSLTVQSNNSTTANTITIAAGKKLTVNGPFTVGVAGADISTGLTATGGGTFEVNNPAADVNLGLYTASNSGGFVAKVDLKGVALFKADVANFLISAHPTPTARTVGGEIYLSNTSNEITADKFSISDTNGTGVGPDSVLYLGDGVTTINTDTLIVGQGNGRGSIDFENASGSLVLNGKGGSGTKVAITIGNKSIGTTNSGAFATIDLAGHTATVNASTLTIAQQSAASTAYTGTLNFGGGTFNADTVDMANRSGSSTAQARGRLNVSGGTFTVNPGGGGITLGSNTAPGLASSDARLTITGGIVTVNGNILQGPITGPGTLNSIITVGAAGTLNTVGTGGVGAIAIGTGTNATGTFTVDGGSVHAAGPIQMGLFSGGDGTFVMNSGTVTCDDWVVIGTFGGSSTSVQHGGTINTVNFDVAQDVGSVGSYTMDNANGASQINTTGFFVVGDAGTGSFNLTNGAVHVNSTTGDSLEVGASTGGIGTLTQSDGTITSSNWVYVGHFGKGTYNMNGGSITADDNFAMGYSAGSDNSAMTMTNGIVTTDGNQDPFTGNFIVGRHGLNVQLNISGGSITTNTIGTSTTFNSASFSVTNALDLSLARDGNFQIASGNGTATATVSGTAAVNVAANVFVGGTGASSSGALTITGGAMHVGLTSPTGGDMLIGGVPGSTGVVNLKGGTLDVANGSGMIGAPIGATASFNFTGGTLKVKSFNAPVLGGNLGGLVQTTADGPSILDVTGNDTTINGNYSLDAGTANIGVGRTLTANTVKLTGGGAINGPGTVTGTFYDMQSGSVSAALAGGAGVNLTKSTGGTVTLSGNNTYGGTTTVMAGTLLVNGNNSGTGAVTVTGTGTLGGTGSIAGSMVLTSGTFAPGNSIGGMNIAGSATYTSGTFDWEYSFGGGNPLLFANTVNADYTNTGTTIADVLSIATAVTLSGTNLGTIGLIGGQRFTLLSYFTAGTPTATAFRFGNAPQDDAIMMFLNGQMFVINYDDPLPGDNSAAIAGAKYITLTAIPEASSLLVMAVGAVFAIGVVWLGKRCGLTPFRI